MADWKFLANGQRVPSLSNRAAMNNGDEPFLYRRVSDRLRPDDSAVPDSPLSNDLLGIVSSPTCPSPANVPSAVSASKPPIRRREKKRSARIAELPYQYRP